MIVAAAPSEPGACVAARLIECTPGAVTVNHYRSSERAFPLRHCGRYYSVSHTADLTAVAFATVPVGVDIERRISGEAVVDLVWTLSSTECSELGDDPGDRLTQIWTTKEASGKALGTGLGAAPHRIHTRPAPDTPDYRVSEVPSPDRGVTLVSSYGWCLSDRYVSLAWSTPSWY
jgi:phosphopantetheinyl transferase